MNYLREKNSADRLGIRDRENSQNLSFGLQHVIDGYGRHEVVIDHDNHSIHVDAMSQQHLYALFRMYRDRMQVLYESDVRIKYVLIFKNFVPAAGASIAHTHSQIVACNACRAGKRSQ